MADYFLCAAGVTLRGQIDERWPSRDHRSDGWIGDASHQATVSDHNPCWTCTGNSYGVVRAIDVDEDLLGPSAKVADPKVANVLANQLIECARKGEDGGRLKYVIFEGKIASGTYRDTFWTWRSFDGDPHTTHLHVSFQPRGDHRGKPFELPIFYGPQRRRLSRLIRKARARLTALRAKRRALPA